MRQAFNILVIVIIAFAAGYYASRPNPVAVEVMVPELTPQEVQVLVPTPLTKEEPTPEPKKEEKADDKEETKEDKGDEEPPKGEWWEDCAKVEPYYVPVPTGFDLDESEESAKEYARIRTEVKNCKDECSYNADNECIDRAFIAADGACMCVISGNPIEGWDTLGWRSVTPEQVKRKQ